jgi:hypothetical protein
MTEIFITINPENWAGVAFIFNPNMSFVDNRTKAGKLLHLLLNDEQRQQLKKEGTFTVRGGKTGKKYVIRTSGYTGNVHSVQHFPGFPERSYCLYVNASVPIEDHFIAQMLLLQYDEERFLRTARF